MEEHARPQHVPPPVLPHASAGRHARTIDLSQEGEFDYGRPFLLDVGRAAVIAESLRENGYPRWTADQVIAELAGPGRERSSIGRLAAGQLERAGWRP